MQHDNPQQQPQQHVGRRVQDAVHGLRGQTPLRYDFEVVPHFAGELPPGATRAALVWQRGTKVLATEAEAVNPHTRACFWRQLLRQQATVYRDAAVGAFAPKEYALKVVAYYGEAGGAGAGAGERRTVGRAKLDFSRFCSADADPPPRELYLQLQPAGRLKVSVRAGWRKDAPVDADALTRSDGGGLERGGAASTTQFTDGGGSHLGEQDLGGFGGDDGDDGNGAPGGGFAGGGSLSAAAGGRRHASSSSGRSTPAQLSNLGLQQQQQQQQQQLGRLSPMPEHGSGSGSATSAKEGRGPGSPLATIAAKRPNPPLAAAGRLPGEIAQFSVPLSPEEQRAEVERQKAAVMAAAQEHVAAMRRDLEAQFEVELERRLARARCCGLFACCWPSPRPRAAAAGGAADASAEVGVSKIAHVTLPITTPDL